MFYLFYLVPLTERPKYSNFDRKLQDNLQIVFHKTPSHGSRVMLSGVPKRDFHVVSHVYAVICSRQLHTHAHCMTASLLFTKVQGYLITIPTVAVNLLCSNVQELADYNSNKYFQINVFVPFNFMGDRS